MLTRHHSDWYIFGMKTFEVRTASFSNADNNSVGGREMNRNGQGTIYLQADKKVDAMATLASFGYFRVSAADCQLGKGNDMDAMLKAGVITEGSLTFVALDSKRVGKAHFNKVGERCSAAIGRLEVDSDNGFKRKFVAS
jgi:hypothetical protein